jgi:hypothetical protein
METDITGAERDGAVTNQYVTGTTFMSLHISIGVHMYVVSTGGINWLD